MLNASLLYTSRLLCRTPHFLISYQLTFTVTKTSVEPERAFFQIQTDCISWSWLQLVLTDNREVCCEWWPTRVNSILRFCSSSNLLKMRQHFLMNEKERMPQSRVALWWSVLCLYGLLDVFGLTWRDHDLRVPLCDLISASKMCVTVVDRNYTEVLPAPFLIFHMRPWEPDYLGGVNLWI